MIDLVTLPDPTRRAITAHLARAVADPARIVTLPEWPDAAWGCADDADHRHRTCHAADAHGGAALAAVSPGFLHHVAHAASLVTRTWRVVAGPEDAPPTMDLAEDPDARRPRRRGTVEI